MTDSQAGTFRAALITILGATTAAGLAEIILGLTQECLSEALLALGVANLLMAGITVHSLQHGEEGEEKDKPSTTSLQQAETTLRTALITILAGTTAVGLVEIFLGLTQECLNEILLVLGGANLVALGAAYVAYSTLQQGEEGEEKDKPVKP